MKRTPDQLADGLLRLIDAHQLTFDGEPVDRAWILRVLDGTWKASGFDEILRQAMENEIPDRDDAEREHLVAIWEQVRAALLYRLRS